jgi:hypothetical protein
MGWIEIECASPNGEPILGMHEIDGEYYVTTESQLYKMLADEHGVRLLPIHQFMQPGHA